MTSLEELQKALDKFPWVCCREGGQECDNTKLVEWVENFEGLFASFRAGLEAKDFEFEKLNDEFASYKGQVLQAMEMKDEKIQKFKAKERSLRKPEFLEKLAELEHEQWRDLMKHLFDKGLISLGHYDTFRIQQMMQQPYHRLEEWQKESDRVFARKVLKVFDGTNPKTQDALSDKDNEKGIFSEKGTLTGKEAKT